MKKQLLLFIAILSASQFFAQKCNLRGVVIDCSDKMPLNGAVILSETDPFIGTVTDENGYFNLNIPLDVEVFTVKYAGYNDYRIEIEKSKPCEQELKLCVERATLSTELKQPIPAVMVEGFRTRTENERTAASIGIVSSERINTTDKTSLLNAVNQVPGVIMEQRGYGGSHRLSIRGSSLRAPFAVRNIKMYLNGIPLTAPDGQTPLELVDPFDVGNMEIIKGPAGSVYGSGNGGVLLFSTKPIALSNISATTGAQMGSYDLYRVNSEVNIGLQKGGIRVSQVYQDNPGYRTQEFNHKNQVNITAINYREKDVFQFYTTYLNARWGLPGGLNQIQADTMPTLANNFSWKNNAHVWRERMMAGVSNKHYFTIRKASQLYVNTSLYLYDTDKLNPYGTRSDRSGYKVEEAIGAGGRMDWVFSRMADGNKFSVIWGGEYQNEDYSIVESTLLNGQPDNEKYNYDVLYHTGMAYLSANADWKSNILIEAGFSLNNTLQYVNGKNNNDFYFDTTATWKSQLLPRLAVSKLLFSRVYAYGALSYGNSNPTIFEMVDYTNNTYNLDLKPEQGRNVELGIKGKLSEDKLWFELNAYQFDLSNFILQRLVALPSADTTYEVEKYVNAGETIQRGIEWLVSGKLDEGNNNFRMEWWVAHSYFGYRFRQYSDADGTYDGKYLAGVPLNNVNAGLDFFFKEYVSLHMANYWQDKTPLNHLNTDWISARHVLNMRCNFMYAKSKWWGLKLYAGINNALNTAYTAYINTNDKGLRYYNPAPLRNYFAGFECSLNLSAFGRE